MLQQIYVQIGDAIWPNELVAQVGTENVRSKIGGVVSSVNNNI